MDRLRVRVGLSNKEIEVEGPPALVSEWWDKLSQELLVNWISETPQQPSTPVNLQESVSPLQSSSSESLTVPQEFGEFLHLFPSPITDVDKVLIAAFFAQKNNSEDTFATRSANELLLKQGFRVANPSECVRRLLLAKRVISLADGKYRVSAQGRSYLSTLVER